MIVIYKMIVQNIFTVFDTYHADNVADGECYKSDSFNSIFKDNVILDIAIDIDIEFN